MIPGKPREIVYPIFLECCQFTTDTFWINVFEELACARAPNGTYISRGFLCSSVKKHEFAYKIEKEKPVQHVFSEVRDLLVTKTGLASHVEKVKRKQQLVEQEEYNREQRKNWNSIKKKNIRNLLIELFVVRMKKEHQLTIRQAQYLFSVILVALAFKTIASHDIDYTDGQIQGINGIRFEKRHIILDHDMYNIESAVKASNAMNTAPACHTFAEKLMSDKWQ